MVPSSACLVLVAALARPECGVVLAREEFEKTWLCYVWYWLTGSPVATRKKKPRFVGKGKFQSCCQGQPVSSSSTAKVVEPLSRGAIGLDQVLGMVWSAKESNAEV